MANALQGFIDSSAGIVIGTTLHTIGAIAMLASLAAFVSWGRHMRHGEHQVQVLQFAAVSGYLAIFVNLVGGFMRTYQGDHPHLTQFATNAWVQLMLIKHVVLFAGMGLMVWLFEIIAPRLLRMRKRGGDEARTWRLSTTLSVLVGVSILVASVFGALTQVALPRGMVDGDDGIPVPEDAARSYQFTGQMTATPIAPAAQQGSFDVPVGADTLDMALSWSPRTFTLTLTLEAPDGTTHNGDAFTGRSTLQIAAPHAGTWKYTVASDAAVQVDWNLAVLVIDASQSQLQNTVTVAPGEFYEINTEMREGAPLNWNWTSTGTVRFDVHTHFDGQVQYPGGHNYEGTEGAGNLTADREGGYSLMWENSGTAAVQVTYDVWGEFTLHSIYA